MVGGLIMAHGDDDGLRVPPRLAPVQVVVLVVRDEGDVVARCGALADELRAAGVRVQLDDERRRVDRPSRHRLGAQGRAGAARGRSSRPRRRRRHAGAPHRRPAKSASNRSRSTTSSTAVAAELDRQQAALLAEATERRESHTVDVTTLDDAREAAATGWARIPWDTVGAEGEAELAQASVSVRCLHRADGSLPESDDEPGLIAVVARSY